MRFFLYKRALFVAFLFLGVFSLTGCGSKEPAPVTYAVPLEIWGVFDDSSMYTGAIEAYKKINPNVKADRFISSARNKQKEKNATCFKK